MLELELGGFIEIEGGLMRCRERERRVNWGLYGLG